jgi:hypothetical protein
MTDESIFTHHTAALDDVRLHYVTAGPVSRSCA